MSRTVLTSIVTLLSIIVLWAAVPSSLFFRVKSGSITDHQVKAVRSFPMSERLGIEPPIIAYVEIIRPFDMPTPPCRDTNGFGFRYNGDKPYATWTLGKGLEGAWASRCIAHDAYHWKASWYVMLFWIIPLRPVERDVFVEKIE